jgi:hypothetical protein
MYKYTEFVQKYSNKLVLYTALPDTGIFLKFYQEIEYNFFLNNRIYIYILLLKRILISLLRRCVKFTKLRNN